MAEQEIAVSELFADFNRRITDVEENLRMLKERLLVTTKTLIMQGDRFSNEIAQLKEKFESLKDMVERQKDAIDRIVKESAELVRKEELRSIERLLKTFDPLKLATEEDVRRIVREEKEKRS